MPGDIFSGWNAIQNTQVAPPPSMVPAIASLGNMIDALEKRRDARAAAERQAQMDALAMRKQDEKDAYYRRKLDLQDSRQLSKDAMDRAKYNQQIYQDVQGKAAKGLHPGTQLFIDEQGNPVRVTPRFVPSDQPPAAPPAQAPQQNLDVVPADFGGSAPLTHAVGQMLSRNPDADSPDELGMHEPVEDPASVEAKRAQMIRQSGDQGGPIDLNAPVPPPNYQDEQPPAENTPAPDLHAPGMESQENEPPHAELMSPEASGKRLDELGVPPLPSRESPPSFQGLQEALANRGANVPHAEAAQPAAEFRRGKWVYDIPGGQPFEIDLEQARQANVDSIKSKLAQIDTALRDPNFALDPATVNSLRRERAMLQADLPANDRSALLAQGGRSDLQSQKDMAAKERLDENIASREKIAEDRNAAMLKAAEMRRRKVTAGAASKASAAGLAPKDLRAIDMTINSQLRHMNWDKLVGVGKQRLDLALRNASAEGPNAATQHMEALMNFFGYIRGGVPAKNETDEWKRLTGTFRNWMDSYGSAVGLDNLFSRYMQSGNDKEYTQSELETVSRMPPQARRSLIQAIKESQGMISGFAKSQLEGLAMKYRSASPPAQRFVQDTIDGLAHTMGVQPKRMLQGDQPSSEAQGGQQMGGMSLDEALKKLLEAKGAK